MDKLIRYCPNCNKKLEYTSNHSFRRANKNDRWCRPCAVRNSMCGDKNPAKRSEIRKKLSEQKLGNKNPVYGKNVYDMMVEKYGKAEAGIKWKLKYDKTSKSLIGWKHSEETKEKLRKIGKSQIRTEKQIEKCRVNTIEGKFGISYDEYINSKSDWEKYELKVRRITKRQPLNTLENYDKRGRNDMDENAYHLDHIKSIFKGFHNGISAEEIGHISNLQMLPAIENLKKGIRDYE